MSKDFLFPTNLGGVGDSLATQATYMLIAPEATYDPEMHLSLYYTTNADSQLELNGNITLLVDADGDKVEFGFLFGVSDHGNFDGLQVTVTADSNGEPVAAKKDCWHDEAPFDEDTFDLDPVVWGQDTTSDDWTGSLTAACPDDTAADSRCTLVYTFSRLFDTEDEQDYHLLTDELKIYEVPAYYQVYRSDVNAASGYSSQASIGEFTEHSYIFMGGEKLENHPKIHALAAGFNDEDHDHDHDDDHGHDHDSAQAGAVSTNT